MEKFFIVTEESSLRKDYLGYRENLKTINSHVNKFMVKHNIVTKEYYANDEELYIVPVDEDTEKFNKVLGKEIGDGLRPFKKNSKINKDWIKSLEENNLKVLRKPYIGFYFNNVYGKHRSRLFNIGEIVYCSLEHDSDFEVPEGFAEIKASEFFKIVEDAESKNK